LFGNYPEIELKKRGSLKNQPASFFGFSNMFSDSDAVTLGDNLTKSKSQVSYSLLDDNLLIHIDKTDEPSRRFSIQLYLFGYSNKTPFALMPKIRMITKYKRLKMFDGRKKIKPDGVCLEMNFKEVVLEVPLKILGEPDFILTSIKTYAGVLDVDTSSFREIDIK
jgi:hypothetical protein